MLLIFGHKNGNLKQILVSNWVSVDLIEVPVSVSEKVVSKTSDINTWHLTITLLIQAVKRETNKYFATGTCFDQFYSHQKRWERVLAMGTCFDEFELVKMRWERIYKKAFFGPLKACYGHMGLCSRWGRFHGFQKYS